MHSDVQKEIYNTSIGIVLEYYLWEVTSNITKLLF